MAYFYPKQMEKLKIPIANPFKEIFFLKGSANVDNKFYNIIIKFANVDRGWGVKRLSAKWG